MANYYSPEIYFGFGEILMVRCLIYIAVIVFILFAMIIAKYALKSGTTADSLANLVHALSAFFALGLSEITKRM
jgi:hypothetical protein